MQLKEKDIKLVSIDTKTTLFFHTETLQIYPFKNDNEVLHFLQYYQIGGEEEAKKHYNEEDYKQIYDFICEKLTQVPTLHPHFIPTEEPVFDTVILPISGHCNLNCPYCFAQTDGGFHFNDYTKEDAKKIIDFVVSKNTEENHIMIVFFGGEPLLRMDLIRFTVQYAKEKYPERTFHFSMTTNGTLLPDDNLTFIRDNHITLLLSVDGPDNEFNLRRYKNNEKSIYDVVKNIEKTKIYEIDTELRATFVNTNPSLVETFDYFEQLKLPFTVTFAYSSENKTHHYADYDTETLQSIRTQLSSLLTYYKHKIDAHETIYNRLFAKLSHIFRFRKIFASSCASGDTFFTITSNGNIYSCSHFMNNESHSIGTIADGVDLEKRKQYVPASIETIEECQDCWIKYLCLGGCTAQKITSGRRNDQSLGENECELQRIVWEFYLKLYYYIMTYAPGYLIKEKKETKEVIC